MPLLTDAAQRLLRRRRRPATPAQWTEYDRAVEVATGADGDAKRALREAARAQADEHRAAIVRILNQAQIGRP
jgi:hypothetical protein